MSRSAKVCPNVEEWCADCGVRIRAAGSDDPIPPSVHTGHIHRPISGETMRAAVNIWSVASVIAGAPEAICDEAGESVRHLLDRVGLKAQAVRSAAQALRKEAKAAKLNEGKQ